MPLGKLQTEADLKRWLIQKFPALARSSRSHRPLGGLIDTNGSGSIVAGSGFSIARNGVGDVTITFDSSFSRVPAVTATKVALGTAQLTAGSPTATSARIVLRDGAFAVVDDRFTFIAMPTSA